jgi:putative spermidine/putrescine transport system substrate-binding protein
LRLRLSRALALCAAALIAVGACSGGGAGDWKSAPDTGKAKTQAQSFGTYGIPDSWANYGESFTAFCQKNFQFDCNTKDHRQSLGEDMSSAQEIKAYSDEKNNPKASLADIGILFAGPSEAAGVVPDYLPPNATKLGAGLKGTTGGWVATFVGVPGYVVNVDFLKSKNIAVPTSWDDLAKPEYKGLVGIPLPGSSGTATTAFVAMNYAHGGTLDNWQPGIDFAKKLLPNIKGVHEGNADEFEKGEVPIQIKYDFNLIALANQVKTKNINAQVVIPKDGSIYAPSALMVNKFDTAHMDFAKMYMDWVLSDEGQTVFAKFGARPIRYVTGDLKLGDDAKTKWLPDDQYANVKNIDLSKLKIEDVADIWNNKVLAGGG